MISSEKKISSLRETDSDWKSLHVICPQAFAIGQGVLKKLPNTEKRVQ